MVHTFTLENGVRGIVKRMEGLLSVTMGVLVGTGSAFESDAEDGLSHFIEHVQFKGTTKHDSFGLADAFDAIGAQVNAFTGKDLTCYYAKATSDHAAEAFALLAELFLDSTFPEEELEKEKGVIVEEIHMDEDSPEDLCLDLVSRAYYGNDTYGRNTLGPAENVLRFTRGDIFAYKKRRYVPENVVLSFAGNITPKQAEELARRCFGGMAGDKLLRTEKKIAFHAESILREKPIEQVHFAAAFPSVPRDDPAFPAVQVMNLALGGGSSSRLFKRVREELGLAYSVYSYPSPYLETGILCVYAGVNPKKADAAAEAVGETLEKFRREGICEEEFLRSKEQVRSSLIFAQESTSAQMLLYGKQMLYKNEVYDFSKRMKEIADLKREKVLEEAEKIDFSRAAFATVGNRKKGVTLR